PRRHVQPAPSRAPCGRTARAPRSRPGARAVDAGAHPAPQDDRCRPGPRAPPAHVRAGGERRGGAGGREVERGGASYTVDTLRAIHAKHPDARLTFIVGADTARTLGSWHEPARLLELASLAVAMRRGSAREDVLDTLAALGAPGRRAQADVRFLEMDPVE